jgi:hypothetical protein
MAQIRDFIVRSGVIIQGTANVTSATGSTQTLQVNGGASIAKSLQVGGAATIYGNETVYGSLAVTGNGRVSAFTASGIVTVTDSTAATSGGAGAVTVAGGVYVGNNLVVNGSGASTATLANNALYVAGGVGIGNSLVVSGQVLFKDVVTFSGTATYVYSTNTIFTDNIQNLHVPPGGVGGAWTINDGKDIGFVFHNYVNSADNDAFLGWANDSGYLEWYSTGTESISGIFTGSTYGIFKTGGIVLVNGTAATSTNTGALTVAGGLGLGGSIYAGGPASANTLTSRSLTSGKVVIVGTGGLLTEDDGLSYNAATNLLTTTVTNAITATNLAAGTVGDLPYQSAVGITSFIPIGPTNYVLTSNGNIPIWANPASLPSVQSAVTASNISGGFATAIAYQTAPGVTTVSDLNFRFDNGTNTFRTVNAVFSGTNAVSSTATGAVQVVGGVGIGGGLFVGGTVTATAFVGVITTATNLANGLLGQIPYQSAAGTTQFISTGTAGSILQMGASSTATFVSTGNIYVGYSNQSVYSNTSTNVAGGTTGSINYQVSPGVTGFIGLGVVGSILQVGATTATFISSSSIYVGYSNTSNNVLGGIGGQIPYQIAPGTTGFINTGTPGSILQMGTGSTATFVSSSSVYVGFANQAVYSNTATNLANGLLGQIPYQSALGVTQFIGTGTNGSLLQMGANTATFVTTANIYVANAVTATNLRGGILGAIPYQNASGVTQFIGTGTAGTILQMGSANTATFVSTSNVHVGYADIAAFALVSSGVANTASNVTINNEQAAATPHYVVSVSTSSGNLPLKITAAWGPYYIPSTGQLIINTNTNASSVSTGALVVGGGAGLGGKLYVGDNSESTLVGNGALVVTGGAGVGGRINSGGLITAGTAASGSSVAGFSSNNFNISSYTSNTINTFGSKDLDAFSTSTYRTARYTVQIVDGTSVHVSELLAFHANGNVYLNEYGIVTNNGTLGTFDAAIVGGLLTLQFAPDPTPTSMTIKVVRTGITL